MCLPFTPTFSLFYCQNLVMSSRDRDVLKKHLKTLKTAVDNERKLQAKKQKEQEKLDKQQAKKKGVR